MDFDAGIDAACEISSDRRHVKKKVGGDKVLFKVSDIRHGQQACEETQDQTEQDWKIMTAEMKTNGVLIACGMIHV